MLSKKINSSQLGFYSTFGEQLSHQHPLYILANQIRWNIFEEAFARHYSEEGHPAKPIRLMVSLLILKHIRNLSDESVIEQWMENIYYQYFSGEKSYACGVPCEASELVRFRNRIGEEGIELIFKESIRINGKDGKEDEATVDTTVQEKNITYPADNKLHRKIIQKCVTIAEEQQSRIKAKLPLHCKETGGSNNVFGVILKIIKKPGRQENKNYEFGSKVSIITIKKSGVMIGALNSKKNDYDAHTVDPAFEQQQRLTSTVLKKSIYGSGVTRESAR